MKRQIRLVVSDTTQLTKKIIDYFEQFDFKLISNQNGSIATVGSRCRCRYLLPWSGVPPTTLPKSTTFSCAITQLPENLLRFLSWLAGRPGHGSHFVYGKSISLCWSYVQLTQTIVDARQSLVNLSFFFHIRLE